MKFLLITGADASGKSTVAGELAKITDLTMLPDHRMNKLLLSAHIIKNEELIERSKQIVFKILEKNIDKDIIFPYCLCNNKEISINMIKEILDYIKEVNGEIYHVELCCKRSTRLKRTYGLNTKEYKKFMKDIVYYREKGIDVDKEDEEIFLLKNKNELSNNHLLINTDDKAPEEIAILIKETFNL